MDVIITGRGVEIDSTLKAYIRRRIDFALSRFSNKVRRIRLVVKNRSGPLGRIEKFCRIRVQLLGKRTVTVSYSDDNVHAAIAYATDQMHRVVARKIALGCAFAVTEPIDRDRMGGIAEK
jgi:ribosome-associated translation inhibitor RaiA